MRLELPYPPSLNRLFRTVLIGVCSKCRAHAHATLYKSQEYQDYTTRLRVELLEQGVRPNAPTEAPVALTIRLYRPRKTGDLDNGLKALLDTLQGYLYANDSQVLELHAYRDDDKQNPRVELEVRELAAPGQQELFNGSSPVPTDGGAGPRERTADRAKPSDAQGAAPTARLGAVPSESLKARLQRLARPATYQPAEEP